MSESYRVILEGGSGLFRFIIDNPLVELFLIPAFTFLIICMGIWILRLSKRK